MTRRETSLTPSQHIEIQDLSNRITLHMGMGKGGIFIVVTDNSRTKKVVERLLKNSLKNLAWHSLDASVDTDVLLKIWGFMHRKALDPSQTVFSVDTDHISNQKWKSLLNAVNIRREYIPEGRLILLIWVSSERVNEIPKYAKDFWSFRTSVHRFQAKPFHRRGRIEKLESLKEQIGEIQELINQVSKEKEPKESVLASLYFRLGELSNEAFELNSALESYRKAEIIYRKLNDQRSLSTTIGNTGLIYQNKGDLDEAQRYHQEALKIDREIGNLQGVANQLGNIGVICRNRGDLDKALEYLQEALKIHKEIRYLRGVAYDLGNIGLIYQDKGDLDEALKYHQEALKIDREIGYLQGVNAALANISSIYKAKGDLQKAQGVLKELGVVR